VLRDKFPFLRLKECPPELKILVADMLSAHDAYLENHARLFICGDSMELLEACAATVENYLENRSIWNELNHYKTHGTLLGRHPIFAHRERESQLSSMKTSELAALKNRHANNLVRNRKALRDHPHDRFALSRRERIERLEYEISLIHSILNTR
jgi:hypothetical protein